MMTAQRGADSAPNREVTDAESSADSIAVRKIEALERANRALERERAGLLNLLESLPGLYLVLTPDLKIIAASHAYLKATLTTAAIFGRDIFDVFTDDPNDPSATGVANLKASFERVLQTNAPDTMAIQKYAVTRADGTFEERHWSPINSPVFTVDRRLMYVVHRVEDVTDFVLHRAQSGQTGSMRARMEQMEAEIYQSSLKVQSTNRKLEEANKELEAFSYSVSHDLRAPLRAVSGYAQIVLEDFGGQLPAEGHRQLNVIRDNAQQMGELIDALLRFSQLNRHELTKTHVDMTELVDECLRELRKPLENRRVEIRVSELPPCDGDRALLKLVWLNLLSNAFKYSQKRETAEVEIGCVARAGVNTYFVRDNGSGFDMRYAGKLFGVFQRLHAPKDFEGIGVGLANVQRIIHRHGGQVMAEGELDRGATFYFTLGTDRTA